MLSRLSLALLLVAAPSLRAQTGPRPGSLRFPAEQMGVSLEFEGLDNGRGGLLVAVPLSLNGKTYRFLLDSGASGHVVSRGLARQLRLESSGRTRVRGISRRDRSTRSYQLPEFGLGKARLVPRPAVALRLRSFGTPFGRRIDGVLGAPLFAEHVVRIDYPRRRLAILRREHFAAPAAAQRLPLSFVLRVPTVEARIDGREPVALKVDTGSALSLILYDAFVREHGLLASGRRDYEAARLVGVGGQMRARIGRLRELRLGATKLRNAMTWMVEPGQGRGFAAMSAFAGNLGSGVLRRFTVSFDIAGEQMWLESSGEELAAELPDFGFEAEHRGGRIVIRAVAEDSAAAAAELEAGDAVLRVGDQDVRGELSRLTRAMEGPGLLRLRIEREGRPRELELRRRRYLRAIRAPGDRDLENGSRRNQDK